MMVVLQKNDFEEMLVLVSAPFFCAVSFSFCSSSCIFFIIWHLPLHFKIGLALLIQFLANAVVLIRYSAAIIHWLKVCSANAVINKNVKICLTNIFAKLLQKESSKKIFQIKIIISWW